MDNPLLIAGPCSAETREQTILAARIALECGAGMFRAGVWKPRSRPDSFQGAGTEALSWLAEAGELLPVCTEVASADHVEQCLARGISNLWIGARTTTNPFLVQEIADALRGNVAVRVMVKNPVSPDAELWAGAVERFQKAGLKDIVLVHRGFFSQSEPRYRNAPQWEVALGMRRRFPALPLICDPSHMAGDSALVEELSFRAMDLGYDGLMVEMHPEPERALSDSRQQLSPLMLKSLLRKLPHRKASSDDDQVNEMLSVLRSRIDDVDERIVALLAERMSLSRRIGECKLKAGVAIHQPSRWDEVMRRVRAMALREGLPQAAVEKIFEEIHAASVGEQK